MKRDNAETQRTPRWRGDARGIGPCSPIAEACESFTARCCLPDVVEFLKGFARLRLMVPSGEMGVPGRARQAASIHVLGR
jgi:hypothetical protein